MIQPQTDFSDFINSRELVLMPGGFGTTLELHGYDLKAASWSGEANLSAPHLVREVHERFHDAGADIHTTNTFRTHSYFMNRVCEQYREHAERLLKDCRAQSSVKREFNSVADELSYWASASAVEAALAVKAASDRTVFVGGSYGPIHDTHSYNPQSLIKMSELRYGHWQQAQLLKDLGVDVLFPETIPTCNEAIAMTEAAALTGLPFITSFVLNPETGNLFDGTPLKEAVRLTNMRGRVAIMINCTPAHVIGKALDILLEHSDVMVGAYPNGGGGPNSNQVGWNHDHSPHAISSFTDTIVSWRQKDPRRVKLIGGCCGASPTYMTALSEALRPGTGVSAVVAAATATEGHAPLVCACH